MAQKVKTDQAGKGELLRDGVHKEKMDEIYLMLNKLDDRKLSIVHRFIKRLIE